MGICISTSRVSGSNSNSTNAGATTTAVNQNREEGTKRQSRSTSGNKQQKSSNQRQKTSNEKQKKNSQKQRPRESQVSRRKGGLVPCGKRTDFGYDKDFYNKYSLGKLLGHGQFGYTYVGIDKTNGDRVAVKRLEKAKVLILRKSELGQ